MKKNLFLSSVLIMFLFLLSSCVTSHFGVEDKALGVPDDFGQTEAAIARAEQSPGAKYCPEKIAQAKELAAQGARVYWACDNAGSSRLLAQARQLAADAELCGPQAAAIAPEKQPVTVCMTLNVQFDIDKYDVKPQYHDDIGRVADFMKKSPATTAVIEGHTDYVGTEEYNLALSQRRAESVMNYLVEKFGIAASRLSAKGFGKSDPIADNTTEQGRIKNRRIEAVIDCTAEQDFVPPPSKVCFPFNIEFATGKADIRSNYHSRLAGVADFMKKYPATKAVIAGHTDDIGSAEYNMKLSQMRAESVMQYLITNFGIEASRLTAVGYGNTRRIDYNTTPAGRQHNRRVEAIIDCVMIDQ
ncbi:MAG: OmpA family protein [Deltaproteobacteria bacterium]|nr:OmpA family protein [Deltaproteobacteria bacterium]TLN04892.1 MAG: OmpA family protein [bacterium]